jgi:hypothetical protein
MKFNCDRLGDWIWGFKRREEEKVWQERHTWKRVFKIYVRLGHGDCRLFEYVERQVPVTRMEWRDDEGNYQYWQEVKSPIYRAIEKNH